MNIMNAVMAESEKQNGGYGYRMVVSVSVVYHCDCMADLHKVKKLKSNHCKSRPLYMGKFCDWISWNGHRMRIIMSHMKAHCEHSIYISLSPQLLQ